MLTGAFVKAATKGVIADPQERTEEWKKKK